jgi:hypothetical protein
MQRSTGRRDYASCRGAQEIETFFCMMQRSTDRRDITLHTLLEMLMGFLSSVEILPM